MIFKKKKIKENNILTKENNFGVDVVGEDIPFNFLDEKTHEISRRKF